MGARWVPNRTILKFKFVFFGQASDIHNNNITHSYHYHFILFMMSYQQHVSNMLFESLIIKDSLQRLKWKL